MKSRLRHSSCESLVTMPEHSEPINTKNTPGHVEPLDYPFVKIPVEPVSERSANYFIAKDIIENSIANSISEGLSVYMVETQIPATKDFEAKKVREPLGQYLASGRLSRSVSSEEYKALLDKYNPMNIAYQELHKHDSNTDDSTTRNIGSTAIVNSIPVPLPTFVRFDDWKCAAANDYNVDENA